MLCPANPRGKEKEPHSYAYSYKTIFLIKIETSMKSGIKIGDEEEPL
jgi:hypothetical protein